MKSAIKRFVEITFGEEDVQFVLNADILKNSFVFLKTGYGAGYKVDVNGPSITIKRVSKLALLLGCPSPYYFKGTRQQDSKEIIVVGRIMMTPLSKYFLLAWTTLIFLALIACFIMAIFLSVKLMVSPSQTIERNLLTAELMFGVVALISVFGGIVISSIKLIARNQKKNLKQFCKSLHIQQRKSD